MSMKVRMASTVLACAWWGIAVSAAATDAVSPPSAASNTSAPLPEAGDRVGRAAAAGSHISKASRGAAEGAASNRGSGAIPAPRAGSNPAAAHHNGAGGASPSRASPAASSANLQHTFRTNAASLHQVMKAQGGGRQISQPVQHQVAAHSAVAMSANKFAGTSSNSRAPGTPVVMPSGPTGSRRAPTGLVTLGGAATHRNVGNASIAGNAVRRPF